MDLTSLSLSISWKNRKGIILSEYLSESTVVMEQNMAKHAKGYAHFSSSPEKKKARDSRAKQIAAKNEAAKLAAKAAKSPKPSYYRY
jgi:hypothetical protein